MPCYAVCAGSPTPAPTCTLQVDRLEGAVEPTWEGLVQPLERIVDRLSRAWGTVSHLKAVKDTEELRKVGSGVCGCAWVCIWGCGASTDLGEPSCARRPLRLTDRCAALVCAA